MLASMPAGLPLSAACQWAAEFDPEIAAVANPILSLVPSQNDLARRVYLHAVGAPQDVLREYPLKNDKVAALLETPGKGLRFLLDNESRGIGPRLNAASALLGTGNVGLMKAGESALKEIVEAKASSDNWLMTDDRNRAQFLLSGASYFLSTYEANRAAFRDLVVKLSDQLGSQRVFAKAIPVENESGQELFVDAVGIEPEKAKKNLVVMVAGTHGIEGFWGSAQMRWLMDEVLAGRIDLNHTGILLIHGYNAWGFANGFRVFENGVDPNRNCPLPDEFTLGRPFNPEYALFHSILNLKGSYQHKKWGGEWRFIAQALAKALLAGIPNFKKAIMTGQASFANSFCYAGEEPAKQRQAVAGLVASITADYEHSVILDTHTGYGKYGQIIVGNVDYQPTAADKALLERLFGSKNDFSIQFLNEGLRDPNRGKSGGDMYPAMGSLFGYLAHKSRSKTTTSMAFEMGTVPNGMGLIPQLWSLYVLCSQSQYLREGAASPRDDFMLRMSIAKLLNPHDVMWRAHAMQQGAYALTRIFEEIK